jgi:hypothetical protein
MKSQKTTTWRQKQAGRIAAGLAVVAICAAGAGLSAGGASAANGWGGLSKTRVTVTTEAPTVAPAPVAQPQALTNGWGY